MGLPIDTDFTINQKMSISNQLQAGIRYLDIRARCVAEFFAMHHGVVCQNLMFRDVLNQIVPFLQTNPTETVLMRLKEYHTAAPGSLSFEEIFKKYRDWYVSLFWQSTSQNPILD
ncbi:phosphatidylinositol-specific phospholipase C domain-containing protein [Bacillus thuringiensis]|nr:phosphatidylinositol-specific phospholipase C domain-containing protein [Bacillus thuringiensis]MDZ3957047.1 phosphatidylinositol-specific phospholipase C domain-containing protein [Bacillus thuringiensis]RGP42392.1 hypothetical protein BTW32_30980 [Bacillus thuringiensis]